MIIGHLGWILVGMVIGGFGSGGQDCDRYSNVDQDKEVQEVCVATFEE